MEKHGYRSLFWPIILIGIGVIWLLGAMNIIPNVSWGLLASMWPLILIVIGLDILIGRRSAVGGAVVGLVAIAAVVLLVVVGPSLGLATSGTLKTETLASEIGSATSADINLNFASQPVKMYALTDKTSLLSGEIDYYGSLDYSESGDPTRRIRLAQNGTGGFNIPWDSNARWDIGLTPNLPIDLTIDAGSGSMNLDLSDLRLTSFNLDQGSGSLSLDLPPSTQPYNVDINGGSGSMTMNLPSDGDLTLRLNGGSGSINISLPTNAAVQLEIRNSGSGSVNVPNRLQAVRVFENFKEGTWETAGFDTAVHKLIIICEDLGSGSFNIN